MSLDLVFPVFTQQLICNFFKKKYLENFKKNATAVPVFGEFARSFIALLIPKESALINFLIISKKNRRTWTTDSRF